MEILLNVHMVILFPTLLFYEIRFFSVEDITMFYCFVLVTQKVQNRSYYSLRWMSRYDVVRPGSPTARQRALAEPGLV